ncbi:hypothetical protein UP06_37380 [Bradyrhizobium sp. LTSP857]|nr:hypothetical protein UP06_37380 [Bradyrhizobium sp. LTSP857]
MQQPALRMRVALQWTIDRPYGQYYTVSVGHLGQMTGLFAGSAFQRLMITPLVEATAHDAESSRIGSTDVSARQTRNGL